MSTNIKKQNTKPVTITTVSLSGENIKKRLHPHDTQWVPSVSKHFYFEGDKTFLSQSGHIEAVCVTLPSKEVTSFYPFGDATTEMVGDVDNVHGKDDSMLCYMMSIDAEDKKNNFPCTLEKKFH